jgi:hypothetical protein
MQGAGSQDSSILSFSNYELLDALIERDQLVLKQDIAINQGSTHCLNGNDVACSSWS